MSDTTADPRPTPQVTTGSPTCYACGQPIDSLRVAWAHRDGQMRPLHPTCARPTPRVHQAQAMRLACRGSYDRAALKALLAGHRELCAAVEALIRGSET